MKSVIGIFGATALLASASAFAQIPMTDTADPAAEPAAAEPAAVDAAADTAAPSEPAAESSDSGSAPTAPAGYVTQDYLGIIGTYTLADSVRNIGPSDIDHALGFSAIYGHQFQDHPHWGYEIHGFTETIETGEALRTDFYRYGGGIDATYAFNNRAEFTPFLLAGGGMNYNDVYPNAGGGGATEDSWDWFLNAGGGFVTAPVTKMGYLRVRGEARYIYDSFAETGDIRIGLGIEIPLLKDKAMPAAKESVQIVEVATGLKDDDQDGVINDKDKCPATPPGTRVDGDGCPLQKIIALKGVTFEFNKTRLRPDAVTILDGAASILKRYPDMNVEVAGHTDNVGSDEYNQKLSEGRADAVRTYFTEHGVPASQMTVKGYGEAEPVADNETEEGRELNRRVELRVLN